jgi:hypothetical protein
MTQTFIEPARLLAGCRVEPIPAVELDRIRAAGHDDAGNAPAVLTDHQGGDPLRCCLRESRPDEPVLAIAYTPPGTAGAYAERGPVIVHADRCAGYPETRVYPPELWHYAQVVRAYNRAGKIADGILTTGGAGNRRAVDALLARPEVVLLHVRNVTYGCYNFAVVRDGAPD